MELALELGMTVHDMTARMPLGELVRWRQFAEKRMLPTRRLEAYLAQSAAASAGGSIGDFLLFQDKAEQGGAVVAADVLVGMTGGGKVHYLKRAA